MKRQICLAAACLGALWMTAPAVVSAQVTNATIFATVVDSSAAAVPGAVVTVVNEETAAATQTTTSSSGDATIPLLPVGRYRVTVEAPSFKKEDRTGIELTAGQKLNLTFTLTVGLVTETVSITAEAPILTTESAEQRSSVGTQQVRELPLARRDWTSLLTLTAGMNQATSFGGSGGVSLNGLAPGGLKMTVDGGDSEGSAEAPGLTMYGGFNYIKAVSSEAIAEVNVAKGIAGADIANALAGNINLITKSGTNNFHGSLFENNQTENVNARNQFLTANAPLTFNQFGGSLGGPIIKNKIFFFGVYEGYQEAAYRAVSGQVPTSEFRAQAIAALPAYKPFLDLFPLPNTAYAVGAVTGLYNNAGRGSSKDNHVDVRGDDHVNDANFLSVRYSGGRPFRLTPNAAVVNFQTQTGLTYAGTMSLLHTSARWSSETRYSLNKNDLDRVNNAFTLGIPLISGNFGFGTAGNLFETYGTTQNFEQTFALTRGRHSLKTGGLFTVRRQGRTNPEVPDIQYNNAADFLANRMAFVTISWGINPNQIRTLQFGGFFQDDFRVNRSLIINMGMRYDYQTVPEERDGRFFTRDAPFGFGPVRPADSIYNADFLNFAPRLGFAWTMDSSGKTVLRGGGGVFTSPRASFDSYGEITQNALYEPRRYRFSTAEIAQYGFKYPLTNDQALVPVKGNPNFPWGGDSIDPNFPNPYSYQWNMGIQRQVTNDLALEASYVGTRGMRYQLGKMYNQPDPATGIRPVDPLHFGQFRYYESTGNSKYHALQTALRKRFAQNFQFNISYTYASNTATGPGDFQGSSPAQDWNNNRGEHGPPTFSIRHLFVSNFLYEIPLNRWLHQTRAVGKLATEGWQFSGIFTGSTGTPFQLLQSSVTVNSRPDYIGGQAIRDDYNDTLQYLNPAAFARVPVIAISGATARPGNIGKNSIRGPGSENLDLALSKNFLFNEGKRLQIRADLFNAMNHTNLSGLVTGITASNFGRLTSAIARTVQFNARFTF